MRHPNARLTLALVNGLIGSGMAAQHVAHRTAVQRDRERQRERSCGILLSGESRDGTLGLSEIKAAGGRTLVQLPGKARVPNMPQSAIDAGVVDAVLRLDDMVAAVLAFAAEVSGERRRRPAEPAQLDADLQAILDILRNKVGHDFRCYKPGTLVRRIRRRIA